MFYTFTGDISGRSKWPLPILDHRSSPLVSWGYSWKATSGLPTQLWVFGRCHRANRPSQTLVVLLRDFSTIAAHAGEHLRVCGRLRVNTMPLWKEMLQNYWSNLWSRITQKKIYGVEKKVWNNAIAIAALQRMQQVNSLRTNHHNKVPINRAWLCTSFWHIQGKNLHWRRQYQSLYCSQSCNQHICLSRGYLCTFCQ